MTRLLQNIAIKRRKVILSIVKHDDEVDEREENADERISRNVVLFYQMHIVLFYLYISFPYATTCR